MRLPFRKPPDETVEQVAAKLDDMEEKYTSLRCKRNGHRRTWNPRQGFWECGECGKVLPVSVVPAPAREEGTAEHE